MSATLRRILVPLDGSRLAEAVLPPAFALAARCGATITLLHVIERGAPATVHGERHLDDVEEAGQYLQEVARRYRSSGVPTEVHTHPNEERDVARSIADHSAEWGADLIAIATHGAGGLRGLLFGRIAQQVLGHSRTPVLLVKPHDGAVPTSFHCERILVPLDRTETTEAALPMTRLIARGTGARIYLVHVVPTVGTVSGEPGAIATLSPTATAGLLTLEARQSHDYLSGLRAGPLRDLDVEFEVRRGDVVAELARAVAEHHIDLIVLSTHGRAGLSGFIAGSVGTRLLSRIDQPMLLIPIADEAGGGGA